MLVSRVVEHLDPEVVAKGGAGLTGDGDDQGGNSRYSATTVPIVAQFMKLIIAAHGAGYGVHVILSPAGLGHSLLAKSYRPGRGTPFGRQSKLGDSSATAGPSRTLTRAHY